jgi:hypothetical protein
MHNMVDSAYTAFAVWRLPMKLRFILVLFVLAASSVTVSNAGAKPVSPAAISPFACCDVCPPICP